MFYAHISSPLLAHCFHLDYIQKVDKIVVIFDKVFRNKERAIAESIVKSALKDIKKDYQLYFHRILCDFNAQIADYGAWSLFIQLERGEKRPMQALSRLQGVVLKFPHLDKIP